MIPALITVLSLFLALPSLSVSAQSLTMTKINQQAPWSIRQEHGIQVYPRELTFQMTNGNSVTWPPGFLMLWGGMGADGKATNDAWVSSDSGSSWQPISGPNSRYTSHPLIDGSRTGHCSNKATGEMYVTGGKRNGKLTNEMWYSSNGTHWIKQADGDFWDRERGPCTIDRAGKVYIVGGFSGRTATQTSANDVWVGSPVSSSNRSLTWEMSTLRAPFYARQGHMLEHYWSEYLQKDVLYMANGYTQKDGVSTQRYNDIWVSADDAKSWQRLNAVTPYQGRMDTHMTIMKNGVMLIAGGDCGGTCNKNDVWASVDGGYNWGECCKDCGWTIREDHVQIVDSTGRFLVMGGSQENQPNPDNNGLANDVWRTSISLHDAAEVIKACSLPYPKCNTVGLTCLPDGYCPCSPFGKQLTMEVINPNPGWSPRFEGGVGSFPKPLKFNHADTGAPITLPAGSIIMWAGRHNYTGVTLNDVWASATGHDWLLIGGRANLDGVQSRSKGQPIDDMQRSSDCNDPRTGKIYSVGGEAREGGYHTSSVQVSSDGGMSWTKLKDAPWPAREATACSVDSRGRVYIFGGHYKDLDSKTVRFNDVWMSSNSGTSWQRQTASAPWADRTQLDGEIWYSPSLKVDVIYMGNGIGVNPAAKGRFNDIWASSNSGVSWTLLTANAPYLGRQDGEMLISDAGIVVVVGGDTGINLPANVNDVWASLDGGIHFGLCNISAGFYPREDHVATFTAAGYLLVTQGEAPQTKMDNQVWLSKENFNNADEIAAACGLTIPTRGVGLLCWPGRPCPRPVDPEDESSTGDNGGDDDDDESSSTGSAAPSDSSFSLSTTAIIVIVVVVILVILVACYLFRKRMQSNNTVDTSKFTPADHQMTQILTQDTSSTHV